MQETGILSELHRTADGRYSRTVDRRSTAESAGPPVGAQLTLRDPLPASVGRRPGGSSTPTTTSPGTSSVAMVSSTSSEFSALAGYGVGNAAKQRRQWIRYRIRTHIVFDAKENTPCTANRAISSDGYPTRSPRTRPKRFVCRTASSALAGTSPEDTKEGVVESSEAFCHSIKLQSGIANRFGHCHSTFIPRRW